MLEDNLEQAILREETALDTDPAASTARVTEGKPIKENSGKVEV
jgi:hypothetical protein